MSDEDPPQGPPQDPPHEPPQDEPVFSPASEQPSSLIQPPGKPDWREQLRALGDRIKRSRWMRDLGSRIQNFEPTQAAEWAGKTFQRQDASAYGKAITIMLCSFFMADLASLVAAKFIPEPPIAHGFRPIGGFRRARTSEDYNVIFSRNLFNSRGIIPGEEVPGGTPQEDLSTPVRTSLPFNLIGTVILQDETRSMATIEDKSASMVYPVRETDEIPAKAKILKVEPRKVTFINVASGRKEFIDIPEDNAHPAPANRVSVGGPRNSGPGIEKVAPNQFNVSRSEVDKALADLNQVLTQARAVPNFENGVANGYKLFQIVPGSIYDKLGLQNGDVITGLNGTPISDPGQAFQMLSELKTANHLELQTKRDGKAQNNIYDIR